MDPRLIIGCCILLAAFGAAVGLLYYYLRAGKAVEVGRVDSPITGLVNPSQKTSVESKAVYSNEIESLKEQARLRTKAKKAHVTLDEKLFQAGLFSSKDKADFYRLRFLCPIVCIPVCGATLWILAGAQYGLMGILLGALVGYQIPYSILDRKIAWRNEEIMFYLPLVIEQISIGVSSSLDIGPCLQRVVQMADERDSHNVVTELLRYAQNYIKSGVPFEEAMIETGKASGHTELKHAFMYLAQVAKHGGEITRQLQELADSVSAQRQAHIEGRIKKLELVATGPVSLVFLGFLIILLVGFGIQLKSAF